MNTNLSSLSIVHRRMLGCRACAIYLARHGEQPHTQPSSSNHTATTHQALEPVAHYTRLNNYFNKQQSSSPSWTVLERRAHNTIFQISIKSKCWESSSRPLPLPLYQSTTLFHFLSLSLSLFATLRLPIAALRFFTWKQPWGGRGEPCWSFTFRIWLLTFSKYINIFFYGIQLVLPKRAPERDSSAWPDENVLQKIARYCATMLSGPLRAMRWQIFAGASAKLGQVQPSRNAGDVDKVVRYKKIVLN